MMKTKTINAREELQEIIHSSTINSSILFVAKNRSGEPQYIPLDGIGYCLENLKVSQQLKFINHCKKLKSSPDELLNFLRKIATLVAARKL